MYSISAAVNAVEIRTVKLTIDFDIDETATKNAWDGNTKLLFLCSPNNPSGNLLSIDKIKSLLDEFGGLVVLDEAYIDFAGQAGFLPLLDTYQNLVVLQTCSKAGALPASASVCVSRILKSFRC